MVGRLRSMCVQDTSRGRSCSGIGDWAEGPRVDRPSDEISTQPTHPLGRELCQSSVVDGGSRIRSLPRLLATRTTTDGQTSERTDRMGTCSYILFRRSRRRHWIGVQEIDIRWPAWLDGTQDSPQTSCK